MNPFEAARRRATPEAKASIDLIEGFFDALGRMDFETVGKMFTTKGLYRDEPTHAADAIGPAAITAKLTNAISGLDKFVMGVDTVVADADRVTSRRTEEWHFPSGEVAKLPVVCIQEIEGGQITRWHEFWNMPSLIEQMPPSWMQEMAKRASAGS